MISRKKVKKLRQALKDLLWQYFAGRLDAKIEIERRKVQEEFSLGAIDYSRVNIKSKEVNRNIEIFNLKKDLAQRKLKELETIKENLESALNILTKEQYELLELSYSKENYTIRQVAANLSLAESTVANKRRRILNELAEVMGMITYN